ncbi:MAG: hypothetical protein AAB877_00545 [Patescibacteria group bacterium]
MQYKATVFEFTSYKYEPAKKRVVFNYKTHFKGIEPITWTEIVILPKTVKLLGSPTHHQFENLLESLHIILGISYWKFHCAPKIKMPYNLSKQEADFWNIVYK